MKKLFSVIFIFLSISILLQATAIAPGIFRKKIKMSDSIHPNHKPSKHIIQNYSFARSSFTDSVEKALENAISHYSNAIDMYIFKTRYPSSINSSGYVSMVDADSWVSGFFPGCLWYLYEYTGNDKFKEAAEDWTVGLENQKNNDGTHDLGFMMYCSFGNGYRLTGKEEYQEILIQTAQTLGSRYNETVGCIRSWDWGLWQFPVIIDNMMNLELMTWAGKKSGDSSLIEIAVNHSDRTIENHFREDYSSFHVVDYNKATGAVLSRETFQGYADSTAWARGQAWGLYGYTMMYRETGDSTYLEQAINIADFFTTNLPEDYIPYWDYNAPNIPDEPKDASAAAIAASALIELSGYDNDPVSTYLFFAEKILENLINKEYTAEPGTNANFILKHSVGNGNSGHGLDKPQIYADYYYIEALIRYISLCKNKDTIASPELINPQNHTVLIDTDNIQFEWNVPGDLKNDTLQYQLYIQNDNADTVINITNKNTFSFNAPLWLEPNSKYQWQVTVTVGFQKASSNIFYFTTPDAVNINALKASNNVNVYKNAFYDRFTILLDLAKPQNVSITIYDVLGRLVYQKRIPDFISGHHKLHVDRGNLGSSSGLCIYSVSLMDQKGNYEYYKGKLLTICKF